MLKRHAFPWEGGGGPTKGAPAAFHSDTQDWPGSGSEFNNACQFEVFFLSQLQRCRLHIFL